MEKNRIRGLLKTEYRYYCSYYFFRFNSNPLYEYHFLINHFQVQAPWILWRGQHADKAVGQSVPHCHRRTSCWWCPNFILMSLWRASTCPIQRSCTTNWGRHFCHYSSSVIYNDIRLWFIWDLCEPIYILRGLLLCFRTNFDG